jgi:hypothetical protein
VKTSRPPGHCGGRRLIAEIQANGEPVSCNFPPWKGAARRLGEVRKRNAMATKKKARQFVEASDSHKHYSEIVDYTLTYFITKAEREGDSRFAEDLRKAKEEYGEEFDQAIEVTEDVYSEVFTDDEIDDLIVLHSNPTLKKARDLTATIMSKILEQYSRVSS